MISGDVLTDVTEINVRAQWTERPPPRLRPGSATGSRCTGRTTESGDRRLGLSRRSHP